MKLHHTQVQATFGDHISLFAHVWASFLRSLNYVENIVCQMNGRWPFFKHLKKKKDTMMHEPVSKPWGLWKHTHHINYHPTLTPIKNHPNTTIAFFSCSDLFGPAPGFVHRTTYGKRKLVSDAPHRFLTAAIYGLKYLLSLHLLAGSGGAGWSNVVHPYCSSLRCKHKPSAAQ